MDLDAFLKGIPVQRKTISGGTTGGRVRTEYETPDYIEDKVPEKTKNYAKPFVDAIYNEVWEVNAYFSHFFFLVPSNEP